MGANEYATGRGLVEPAHRGAAAERRQPREERVEQADGQVGHCAEPGRPDVDLLGILSRRLDERRRQRDRTHGAVADGIRALG